MAESAKHIPDGTILHSYDPTLVAIDNGFADQKAAFWVADGLGGQRIAEVTFPSRARLGVTNVNMKGGDDGVYYLNGDPWTVGEHIRDPERVTGKQYAHSEINAVLVNHSLITAGFSAVDVRLATGVPISHFYGKGGTDEAFLEKIKRSLKVEIEPSGGRLPANIVAHDVYPESVGAAIDWLVSDLGEEQNTIEMGIAVCDIGGNTTDISVIDSEANIDISRSGSAEKMGVMSVRERLGAELAERFKIERLRDGQLDAALRSGLCKVYGKEHDVVEQISEARRITGRRILNFVTEKVGDGADLDAVIFVGGGASVLSSIVQEYPNAIVAPRPEYANARGFLKQMTFIG